MPGETDRWEHGSDFDYPASGTRAGTPDAVGGTGTTGCWWHSGRDALRALAASERARFSRVFFPSFYCQDVPVALQADGFTVLAYPDAPDGANDAIELQGLRAGDAVVVSNTLGLRARSPLAGPLPSGVTLVEDHTHAPFSAWAASSSADYAFASLRKWLPIPDGARLWSPAGLPVPAAPACDAEHAAVTLRRLSGMLLKSRYLAGEAVDKPAFRALLVEGEHQIGHGAPGAISPIARALVDVLPVDAYRAAPSRTSSARASCFAAPPASRCSSRTARARCRSRSHWCCPRASGGTRCARASPPSASTAPCCGPSMRRRSRTCRRRMRRCPRASCRSTATTATPRATWSAWRARCAGS